MMDADVGCVQRTGTGNGAFHAPYIHQLTIDRALVKTNYAEISALQCF